LLVKYDSAKSENENYAKENKMYAENLALANKVRNKTEEKLRDSEL
jgi:hypothetical protein